MIRESTVKWTRNLYRPLRRVGRRAQRQLTAKSIRPSRQPERFPALDIARFVLIALVVIGHFLEQLVNAGPVAAALYRWIYLFHMPAFVLISGALSKPNLTRRRAIGIATGLLIPYLVFQTLYPAWNAWLFHAGDWSQGYLTPCWLLWYLPSLACWRLLLPLFARVKWSLALAVALALGAGAVVWIGYPFSLSRTLVFFPLLLLGDRIGAQRLQRAGATRKRRIAAAMTLSVAAVAAWFLRDLNPEWLYAAAGYAALRVAPLRGSVIRLALLCASVACAGGARLGAAQVALGGFRPSRPDDLSHARFSGARHACGRPVRGARPDATAARADRRMSRGGGSDCHAVVHAGCRQIRRPSPGPCHGHAACGTLQ